MTSLSPINSKAIGLTCIGNPIYLIAQLNQLSKIANGYSLYICLNIAKHSCSGERLKAMVNNFYKIIKRYEDRFKKICVIDLSDSHFVTHGSCIDHILHCYDEDAIAIFEEDAFVFDRIFFEEQFARLEHFHVVMGMNDGYPNNYKFFEKLINYVNKDTRPGKESVFFIRKDIIKHFDWLSFDYFTIDTNTQFKLPFTDTIVKTTDQLCLDTSEFFSFGCIMHPQIHRAFYTEKTYAYWHYYASNKIDAFYIDYAKTQQYCHYFNSALFLFLPHHHTKNTEEYKNLTLNFPHPENFLFHISTYVIQLALLRTTKRVYIDTLGRQEYELHKKSLKQLIMYLFRYYGLWRMKHNIKIEKFLRFTYSYIETHHGPVF